MSRVLVIGSAGLDIKAQPEGPLQPHLNNRGKVRNSVGGVARNIAENLARLDQRVRLLSVLGDDGPGLRVLRHTRAAGVRVRDIRIMPGGRTLTTLALLDEQGEPQIALMDYEIMSAVNGDYLHEHEAEFARADIIVIDATLSEEALAVLFELAGRYNVRVCADPTTPALASKLCPFLNRLFLITPNAGETTALCGMEDPARDRESALEAARRLVSMGVQLAVVTLGDQGVAYADGRGAGYIRAVKIAVLDPTGAGDAFTGAVIFGLLNEVEIDEAMRLGMTAASLTLQSSETVVPSLSQELLYDKLVV